MARQMLSCVAWPVPGSPPWCGVSPLPGDVSCPNFTEGQCVVTALTWFVMSPAGCVKRCARADGNNFSEFPLKGGDNGCVDVTCFVLSSHGTVYPIPYCPILQANTTTGSVSEGGMGVCRSRGLVALVLPNCGVKTSLMPVSHFLTPAFRCSGSILFFSVRQTKIRFREFSVIGGCLWISSISPGGKAWCAASWYP